ncbi:MAG TPA: hypothetical protein VMR33_20640 [Candidatus Baltobacteraceae bacterium]|nr:hypothetical protein [Candidatus Baltobacteraceae bacterium]
MKILKSSLCLVLATAFAGCASHSTVLVDQPVGPDLARPRIDLNKGSGRLLVYSALESEDQTQSDHPTHSSYIIYDMDGKILRRVDNRSGSFYQSPMTVSLLPGEYRVKGRATNAGLVVIPVIVKENKTTVVDLEGSVLPQHKPTGAGQWIRLPDGQVIGMRSE